MQKRLSSRVRLQPYSTYESRLPFSAGNPSAVLFALSEAIFLLRLRRSILRGIGRATHPRHFGFPGLGVSARFALVFSKTCDLPGARLRSHSQKFRCVGI